MSLDRRLWSLAWPLMLTNITVPLLGLVDTAVLGHLDDARFLGAVAIGANLFSVLYWTFGFMRMGTTGLAAQALGRDSADDLLRLLVQSLVLATTIGLGLILLQQPLIRVALWLMAPGPELHELAYSYAQIRIYSAPAVLCQYTVVGWLIGTQFPRDPMFIMILANALNMALDVLFVTGFGWQSDGVALATLLAEYVATGTGLWLVARRCPSGARFKTAWLTTFADYRRLIAVNRHIMVRTILLLLAFAFFTAQGARMGETVLAANAVLLTFLLIISNGLDGFANGAEALVGEAIGQRSRAAFRAVFRVALRWSLIGSLLFAAVFWLAGDAIVRLLTDLQPVRDTAHDYLPWVWLLPLAAVWSYLLDGVFIGATRTRAMQNAMLISVLGVYLPVWWLAQPLGNHGLWLALTALVLARAATMGWVFARLSHPWRWF
ncbi:MATE family efflux transporter [Marinobacteraceae bacterium S3BR75-40.1]